MKTISVHVREEDYAALKTQARWSGRSVASLIREAMQAYLKRERGGAGSILHIEAHDSGKMRSQSQRDVTLDDMLSDRYKRS